MTSITSSGKRLALMVQGAGISENLLNEMLGQRGFSPVVMVSTVTELVTRMRALQATLVIVPIGGIGSEALFEQELRKSIGTIAIGTATTKDADIVLAAMRSGILEFLVTPADAADVRAAVARVLALCAVSSERGQIYTIYAAKGGLGTSTVAASLSWELARRHGQQGVCLTDLTTTGAGVRVMLDINPMYDLGNIAARAERIDRELVRSVIAPHPDGIAILAAAEEVDAAETLSMDSASRLFDVLRQEYAYTVVDSDHHFADPTLSALDAADKIVLVTQLDVSALRSTQRSLGVLGRLGYSAEKTVIVVNRHTDRDRISVVDAEAVLRRPIDCRLPNDYLACSDATTNGQFVQRFAATSPLVSGISALASLLSGSAAIDAPTPAVRAEKRGFARMFARK